MAKDYDILKKHYGEKFAQFCRATFPTILEQGEGVLAKHVMSLFAPNKNLYVDIVNNHKENEFKNYVYDRAAKTISEASSAKSDTPETLMRKANYTLHKCETVEDVEKFKKYWKAGETLCTFWNIPNRLSRCHIFFAVKDGAERLKREDYKKPMRQDEYGTSVISIQFARGDINNVSIKNRYNHTVQNPDATFSNDLENIYPGLTDSFSQHYGYNFTVSGTSFELPKYIKANDDKFYKYNVEVNGVYYCPDNVIIRHGAVIQLDKFSQILVGNVIFDIKNKTVSQAYVQDFVNQYNQYAAAALGEIHSTDSFISTIGKISKIDVQKGTTVGGRIIKITHDDSKQIIIEIDKNNDVIGYTDNYTAAVGDYFLSYFKNIQQLNMPSLQECGLGFLRHNEALHTADLSGLKTCKTYFMEHNKALKSLNLPNLEFCGSCFLQFNEALENISAPKLRECKDAFLSYNKGLKSISLPSLEWCVTDFIGSNESIESVNLPKLQRCGHDFLKNNKALTALHLPNLQKCCNDFLANNKNLSTLELPRLMYCGDNFIGQNEGLQVLILPSLKSCGLCFMQHNEKLKDLHLPQLKNCEDAFLIRNTELTELELPELESCGNNFLFMNKALKSVKLPKLKYIPHGFRQLQTSDDISR